MLIPHSAQFAAIVAASHEVATVADLWYDGTLIAAGLHLASGAITIADDDLIRSRLTCEISDPWAQIVPGPDIEATAGVYGHEIHVRTGAVLPGGRTELLSAGWFRIQSIDYEERFRDPDTGGGALLHIDALDRMSRLDAYQLLAAEQPPAGATCLGEIRRLAAGVIPIAAFPAGLSDPTVPADLTYVDSRSDAVGRLAAAAGVRAYIDRDGALTVRPVVAPGADADWTVHGGPDGGLYQVRARLSADGRPNAVQARGETAADRAPVQALAVDDDPASATRWDGPYGRVTQKYFSPLITTTAAAAKAARTRLDNLIAGRDRQITIDAAPHPGVQPGQSTIAAVTPRLTYTGLCVAMSLPCGPKTCAYTLRVPETGISYTGAQPWQEAL